MGNYFRADYSKRLTVLSLNTLLWRKSENPDRDFFLGFKQLKWFKEQLEGAKEG